MLVSVSRSFSDADNAHLYVDAIDVQNFKDLAKIVCGPKRWSPLIWTDGIRRQENFERAEFVVLDFDDGKLGVAAAVDHFTREGVRFILGVTRSHRIPKGTTAAQDRFRVVMHMDAPVTHLPRYKQNMRRIISAYPADTSCGDGARIYRPCTKIIAAADGDRIPMLPFQEPKPKNPDIGVTMRLLGKVPRWITEVLSRDCPGQRNQTVFRVAAKLAEYGFSEGDIRRMIFDSPISLSDAEKESAIGSGLRSAGKNT